MSSAFFRNNTPFSHVERVLMLFFPVAMLICVGTLFLYQKELRLLREHHAEHEQKNIAVAMASIKRNLQTINRDLLYLVTTQENRELIDSPDERHFSRLANDWVAFSQAKRHYDKIRWIDETGMERLRVDYELPHPVVIQRDDLQNKRDRYFFDETFRLNRGEIFISQFDLNVEDGKIEIPYKPTIRIGMPVFDSKGNKRGINLINYSASQLIARIKQITSEDNERPIWLVNRDGYWLKGQSTEDEFGFMFGRDDLSMAKRYPAVWERISSETVGQFESDEGLWTFGTVYPLIEDVPDTQDTFQKIGNIDLDAHSGSGARHYYWKTVAFMPAGYYNAGVSILRFKMGAMALILLALFLIAIERLMSARTREKMLVADLTRKEERLSTLVKTIPDMIWLKDANGTYVSCNPAFERFYGAREEDLVGKNDYDLVSSDIGDVLRAQDRFVSETGKPSRYEEWFMVPNKGHQVLLEKTKVPVRTADGELVGIMGIGRDITERKLAEEELKLAATVYRHSDEAMMITDADNRIVAVNPAFEEITGYSAGEVIGRNPRMLRAGRHDKIFHQRMVEELDATGHWEGELWKRRKGGDVYVTRCRINAIFNEDGTLQRRVALFSDITRKKQNEELIWQHANFDQLSGLPNRRMFLERLRHEINKTHRTGDSLALLFIDLDNFKDINDTLGHDAGDLLLNEAAQRLNSCVRETDMVARLGGDEFTVLMGQQGKSVNVERVVNDILKKLSEPFMLNDEYAYVSASIGITFYPQDAGGIDDLLKNADQAMYAAKQKGRNRSHYFTASMQEEVQARVRLVGDLRQAIASSQFRLMYQPIVDLASGAIHKAEALIRWQHPVRGLIGPAEFVRAAEDTGMILAIGDWAFQAASKQAAQWRAMHDPLFQVSVNVSPVQFRNDGIELQVWFEHLRRAGLSAEGVVVEITEGLLLDASENVTSRLLAFRNAGIQVALDDFGTGYSSLSYLKKFDIDYLKIDQAFVRNLGDGSDDLALCEAIIIMAHKLGLKVIAEGVETKSQRDLLVAAGCDYAQGFYFSEPVDGAELDRMLQKQIASAKKMAVD